MKIKLLILDEDIELNKNWADEVLSDTSVSLAGCFTNLKDYKNEIFKSSPDVVYLNLKDDGMKNLETIRILKRLLDKTVILVEAKGDDESFILNAIGAGASGYVTRQQVPGQFLAAIKEIYQRGFAIGDLSAGKLIDLVHQQQFKAKTAAAKHPLTPREQQIISRLVKGDSYKMIAMDFQISYETVRSHIKNIYTKLKVSSLTELVATALNNQLI